MRWSALLRGLCWWRGKGWSFRSPALIDVLGQWVHGRVRWSEMESLKVEASWDDEAQACLSHQALGARLGGCGDVRTKVGYVIILRKSRDGDVDKAIS